MKPKVKERPILFNAEMVKRILDGRKTQTRRLVKPQPKPSTVHPECKPSLGIDYLGRLNVTWITPTSKPDHFYRDFDFPINCPYGKSGDRLWVRETWAVGKGYEGLSPRDVPKESFIKIWYLADGPKPDWAGRTRVSIHMPRYFSRINLAVGKTSVEQIQEITWKDSISEGIYGPLCGHNFDEYWKNYTSYRDEFVSPIDSFHTLWDSIHSNDGFDWHSNPFVWVVEFKLLDKG